mmetsp:Transcript_13029/g.41646  ORF Transcript_13029/g.41646 Transcript_13029/m.41646 type:complete len:416 (+) Transcript_13029:3-1250(+)
MVRDPGRVPLSRHRSRGSTTRPYCPSHAVSPRWCLPCGHGRSAAASKELGATCPGPYHLDGGHAPERAAEGHGPRDSHGHREREGQAEALREPHRLGELRAPVRARGGGLRHGQQVLRGLPGRSVLRRQRVHRPGRVPLPAARAPGLQARPQGVGRERPGPERLPRELPGVHRPLQRARPHHGPGPAPRRPPLPRLPDRHQEDLHGLQVLRVHTVQAQRGDRPHRLRRVREVRHAHPAEDPHRRHQRLLPAHRLRPHAPDRGPLWRLPACGHGAHLRPRRGRHDPLALRVCGRRHHHDAQVPARPARSHDLLPQGPAQRGQEGQPHHVRPRGEDQRSGLPGPPGRPPQPVHHGAGRGAEDGTVPGVPDVPGAGHEERQGLGREPPGPQFRPGFGRHRQPPPAHRPALQGGQRLQG